MKLEVKIDENCNETKILIEARTLEDEIIKLIENLQNKKTQTINGFKDEEMYILKQSQIETIYTEEGKVYARENNNKYLLKKKLYELEEILDPKEFIRISNSEIVNIKKVSRVSFQLTGSIILYFTNGNKTFVSRRCIKKIKEFLNI